ncbi:MAG: ArsA family ATPase [Candidatus Odinarchaeota archaeon]|nr:ArsA family ATPase [Candidatus Odinarchaeota archaeon]
MLLTELFEKDKLRFLLFGGKGGVGKTSCAAATALWAAENGNETLVISTDPAHSLSDSFGEKIGDSIRKINGIKNLYGLEIDPKKAIREYSEKLKSTPELGLPIDIETDELEELTTLTPPGADEALAFAKVLEFIEKPEYDLIIFDTAPTGHTLRLLSLPDILNSWVGKLIKMRAWIQKMTAFFKRILGRGEEEDKTMEYLEKLKKTIEVARAELSNEEETRFIPVMIPEVMSIYETERLVRTLYEYEIPVTHIVVNMIHPEVPNCTFCAARRSMQIENLKIINEYYSDFSIIYIPFFPTEIRGIPKLKEFARYLFEEEFIPKID